jgi:hypothetical protein
LVILRAIISKRLASTAMRAPSRLRPAAEPPTAALLVSRVIDRSWGGLRAIAFSVRPAEPHV